MVPVALAFASLYSLGGPEIIGILLAAATVPQILLLLLGGATTDRVSPRSVLLVTDALQCSTQAVFAVLLSLGVTNLYALVALQIIYGASAAFFKPAFASLTPRVVDHQALPSANAMDNLVRNLGRVAGPALAGLMVVVAEPALIFYFDSASFAVSFVCIFRMSTVSGMSTGDSLLIDIRSGFTEFWSRKWLVLGALHAASYLLIVSPALLILGPTSASTRSGGAAVWGTALAVYSVGEVCSSFIVMRLRIERRMLWAVLVGVLDVPFLLALALWEPPIVLVAAFVAGIANGLAITLYLTSLQLGIPESALGRVNSVDLLISVAFAPVGLIAVGAIASSVDTRTLLTVLAVSHVSLTIAFSCFPQLRTHRDHSEPRNVDCERV
jgi:hypothetical protein